MLEINGELRPVKPGQSIFALLGELGINPALVVIEYNGHIPQPESWEEVLLKPGDRLEIVRFIGGG